MYVDVNMFRFITLSLCISLYSSVAVATEKQMVMGAGPSTHLAQLFFDNFSKNYLKDKYSFEVPARSIKHAGGIKASNKYIFGRTGRPLNNQEKAMNKGELFLARIPIAIVLGKSAGVKSIELQQLKDIMTGKTSNWSRLGGHNNDIVIVGRENTEALFSELKRRYEFFNEAKFHKVLKRDHQVVNLLSTSSGDGVISFGAKHNFENQYHLEVHGFNASISLGLVYDLSNSDHELVKAAEEYLQSKQWRDLCLKNAYLPPETPPGEEL